MDTEMTSAGPFRVDGIAGFHVVFMTTRFASFPDVQREAPERLAEHIAASRLLHDEGPLLLAGAFRDRPGHPVQTMAVLATRDEARRYAENDPFVRAGLVRDWDIREWANMFRS